MNLSHNWCTANRRTAWSVRVASSILAIAPVLARLANAAQPQAEQASWAAPDLEEVVISARKKIEADVEVPISVTQYDAATLARLNVRSFEDYATKTPNLSFSFGTAELGYAAVRSMAIRGISGEGTVGMYVDDVPVPESIDPRVVDIERIEIIKGPQGTLFGQGSLGGTVRIITKPPAAGVADAYVEARAGLTRSAHGPDAGVSFARSASLSGDALTGRLVGFADHTSGFLTRSYPDGNGTVRDGNQGASKAYGGSLALLWQPQDAFDATLRIMGQWTSRNGWVAPYAPLPRFAVSSIVLDRAVDLQERSSDRWYLPSLVFNYRWKQAALTSSSSYFNRKAVDREDASEGTRWFYSNVLGLDLPPNLPSPWDIQIPAWRATNETRLSFQVNAAISGVLGLYFSSGSSTERDDGHDLPGIADSGLTSYPGYCADAPSCPSFGSNLNWYSSYVRSYDDRAVFGELYFTKGRAQLTLGMRAYRDSQEFRLLAMGAGNGYSVTTGSGTHAGVTPKVALAYDLTQKSMLYASVAKGYRKGVVTPPASPTCGDLEDYGLSPGVAPKYKADSVWSYELGAKAQVARVLIKGSIFQTDWHDMRQRILLPVCYFTWKLNVGAARARGGEVEISGRLTPDFEIRAGLGYVDAKVTDQGLPGLPAVGSRVVQIPQITGNLSGTLTRSLTPRVKGFSTLDLSYVGRSTSTTAGLGSPLVRGGYSLINASMGIRWDAFELSALANNIGNKRPNYGDLNPAGYVRHAGALADSPILPRVATAQAFNAALQLRYRF